MRPRSRKVVCWAVPLLCAPMTFDEYRTPDDGVRSEEQRLAALSSTLDPRTFRVIDRIGVTEGSICLEAGAGSGTVSRGLAERVGSAGRVWSIDKDLRFHPEMPPNVEVRGSTSQETSCLTDTSTSCTPGRSSSTFLNAMMCSAVWPRPPGPGGASLSRTPTCRAFTEQPLPEPYGTVHRLLASDTLTPWRDPNFGTRLVECFTRAGFEDLTVEGATGLMYAGQPSGEWWFIMVDRVLPQLVGASVITSAQADGCREQLRESNLTILGPLMLSVWGRRPKN